MADKHVAKTRKLLSEIFRVPLQGIIFCGSGTESDNLAIKSCFDKKGGFTGNLVTTRLEHAAVTKTAAWLEERGVELRFVPVDSKTGLVDLEKLEELVDEETKLLSIHHVNSETGVIQDLAAIAKVAKAKNPNLWFHSDGVQAFTKISINLKSCGIDLYSISGHKFHGIKGVGALILTRSLPLQCLIHGGGQEFGLRSGTENVAAIAAMGIATEIAYRNLEEKWKQVDAFSHWFEGKVRQRLPFLKLFSPTHKVPHIISLAAEKIPGEVMLHHLAAAGILVSTGSACNANSKRLSETLKAMNFSHQRIKGTIRLSLAALELPQEKEVFWEKFEAIMEEMSELI